MDNSAANRSQHNGTPRTGQPRPAVPCATSNQSRHDPSRTASRLVATARCRDINCPGFSARLIIYGCRRSSGGHLEWGVMADHKEKVAREIPTRLTRKSNKLAQSRYQKVLIPGNVRLAITFSTDLAGLLKST